MPDAGIAMFTRVTCQGGWVDPVTKSHRVHRRSHRGQSLLRQTRTLDTTTSAYLSDHVGIRECEGGILRVETVLHVCPNLL